MPMEEVSLIDASDQLTPQQLADLSRRISGTGLPEAPPPVDFNVSINIQDSSRITPQALYALLEKTYGGKPPLTLEDLTALYKIQSELVSWIQQAPENAALFAVAPVAAVRKSGLPVPAHVLDRLDEAQAQAAPIGLAAGIGFERVELTATHVASKEAKPS